MAKKKRSVRDRLKEKTQEHNKNKDSGSFSARVLDLSDYEEVSFFQPKKGKQSIDIIPFEAKTDSFPKLQKGDIDYVMDFFVHYDVGPGKDRFLCLQKTCGLPCPVCEESDMLKEQEGDEKIIEALRPRRRVLYNVIDINNEDKGIQLFETSHYLFEKELLEEAGADEELIIFSDIEDGRTIKFRASEKKFGGNSFTEFKSFTFEERDEPYEDDIIDEAYSLDKIINVPDYQTVYDSLHGINHTTEEDEEDEDEEEVEEKPSRKSKGKSKSKKKKSSLADDSAIPFDNDEEEEDEDEEEAPKKKGKKKSKKKKKSDDNECPSGYTFGEDCDEYDECLDCEVWEECSAAQE